MTSTRGPILGATAGMQLPARDRTSWAGSPSVLRRRARNAPDQFDERRAVDGCDLAGQPEAAPGIVVSVHHRAPQTESAKCTELGGPIELGPGSVPGSSPGDRIDLDVGLSYVSHRRTLNTRRHSEGGHQVPHHMTDASSVRGLRDRTVRAIGEMWRSRASDAN